MKPNIVVVPPGKKSRFSRVKSVLCPTISKAYKYMIKGVILIAIFSSLIAIGGLDTIILRLIKSNRVIKSGTAVWEIWRTMPVDIFMKLYLFNITNPEEFSNGAKAKLTEMGPYVFILDLEKVDLYENSTDHTIKFRMLKWQMFQPHLSGGSLDDKVTFVNAVFVIAAAVVRDNLEDDFFRQQFDEMLSSKGEKLWRTEKVGDLLFDGINIRTYTEFMDNPVIMDTAREMGFKGLPPNIANHTFGLFKGTNGTDDGWLVVHSGIDDTDLAGVVISHNGKKKMTAWREGGTCNDLRGTDATFLPPRVSKTEDWWFFITLVCRSVSLSYYGDSETKGVRTWRFSILKMFQAPKTNPDNWCFCPVMKNETGTCQDEGISSLAPCFFGAPISVSHPHFYGAERWIQRAVEGLKPNFDRHVSKVDIHPFTGVPLVGWGRFQLVIELTPYEEMPSFSDVRHAYIPLAWIEAGLEAENWHAKCFLVLDWFRKSFTVICLIFIAGGMIMLSIGLVMLKGRKKATILTPQPENDKDKLWAVKVAGEVHVPPPSVTAAVSPQIPENPTTLDNSNEGHTGIDFSLMRKTKVKAVASKRSKQALRSLRLSR